MGVNFGLNVGVGCDGVNSGGFFKVNVVGVSFGLSVGALVME